jgi:hypothetical protein
MVVGSSTNTNKQIELTTASVANRRTHPEVDLTVTTDSLPVR